MVRPLVFYEPGHFHAALTLRRANPRVAELVHLYARPGPERAAFLALVAAFNARAADPTGWRVEVHDQGQDLLARLIEERRGEAVVLAGRNDTKLSDIAALHDAGFHVLADKPWAIDGSRLDALERATGGGTLALDIMTERHEVVARLRKRLTECPEVFGGFLPGSAAAPAIEMGLTHHLLKVVNGEPLRRPPWYYDVRIQGDGLVDVQSHMTDQAQWLLETGEPYDYRRDVELIQARRWTTEVPLSLFQESTGADAFPDSLAAGVEAGVLALPCNGRIDYRLRGRWVRQSAEWGQREPEGAGDYHHTVLRGRAATVRVRQGPETGFTAELHVTPAPGRAAEPTLRRRVEAWAAELPGLELASSDLGYELLIPAAVRSGHEAHFALVLEQFLDYLDAGRWPRSVSAAIRTRYELLGRAHDLAAGSS